ncbi:MAG: FGGY family carbohydrate kinase [Bacteroidetes bacterium]|nr:FGGY family carbohydrate kinase [Bacteroidota bacterium]
MLLLGIDIGTSSVKVSVVDAATQQCIASAQYPETESPVLSPHPGWAEQSPDQWWEDTKQAILKCHASASYDTSAIAAIGIAYQMHGLVLVDKEQHVLRNSIIWCDSRAVQTGNEAFAAMGEKECLSHLLNSPGNFTASKLAWVKQNEPAVYYRVSKFMLPGDFIAMKMTGEISTTAPALSEGIFWDFKTRSLSSAIMNQYGFDATLVPSIKPVFTTHGLLKESVASRLSLKPDIPICYKAGDQPNNALSLNVLNPGEVAATAGTSGVVYAVTDELVYDQQSRVNSFAHVNHTEADNRIGVLLCINGCGATYRWIKEIAGGSLTYAQMNEAAATVRPGSDGVQLIPFGNGAERILNNKITGAHIKNLDYTTHTAAHLFRAAQEGIVYAFRYGLDIMRENNIQPVVVRAGRANMFLSDLFTQTFASITGIPVELHEGDGSTGAAIGAGIGAGIFSSAAEAFSLRKAGRIVEPAPAKPYEEYYEIWKDSILQLIK